MLSVMLSLRCASIKSMVVSHALIPDGLGKGGFDAFVGDHNKGWIRIKHFEDAEVGDIPKWMHEAACTHYPNQYPGA